MATTTRTRAPNSTKRKATAPRSRSTASRANSTSKASTNENVGGYAGGFLQAVRARPFAAAAIAAGAAGASAFLWAKRAMIGEQASAAGEKLGELRGQASEKLDELRGQASEQASALKDKVSERFFASSDSRDMNPASAAKADRISSRGSKRSQSDIAAEALSIKQIGEPMVAEQSKIGAVAY